MTKLLIILFHRPLRDDEKLPVRTHRIVSETQLAEEGAGEVREKRKHKKDKESKKKKKKRDEKKEEKVGRKMFVTEHDYYFTSVLCASTISFDSENSVQ